jgi:hypothetical protein
MLQEALAQWKTTMDARSLGHEDIANGPSTYNWMKSAYEFFLGSAHIQHLPTPIALGKFFACHIMRSVREV